MPNKKIAIVIFEGDPPTLDKETHSLGFDLGGKSRDEQMQGLKWLVRSALFTLYGIPTTKKKLNVNVEIEVDGEGDLDLVTQSTFGVYGEAK